jgi:hypothetical protein
MSQSMLFGAVGAGLSCLATAPLLTVRTKLMVQVGGRILSCELAFSNDFAVVACA